MVAPVTSPRPSIESHCVWQPKRKTPSDADIAKEYYQRVMDKHRLLTAKFRETSLASMPQAVRTEYANKLRELGFFLDFENCHVAYLPEFEPLQLDYDVCYVRHGKTEGNTEPRIFQGFCDYWENQLNEVGRKQALEAAAKMEQTLNTFTPDLIICSPLGRAIETGEAFFKNHPEIPCRVHYGAREQQFGCWDNVQLRFMSEEDIAHLFYLDQNVLVKAPEPHVDPNGKAYEAENFVDLILREAEFLKSVNQEPEVVECVKQGRKAKVLMYGHSMAGAAISMLLGHGRASNDQGALGFDGKFIMPNATPTFLFAQKPAKQTV